ALGAVSSLLFVFFFQAEDGIRDWSVTGVQTCALPISAVLVRIGLRDHAGRGLLDRAAVLIGLGQGARGSLRDRAPVGALPRQLRSEERRVGKEWRAGRWAEHWRQKVGVAGVGGGVG